MQHQNELDFPDPYDLDGMNPWMEAESHLDASYPC
jgi:hypothetical protein